MKKILLTCPPMIGLIDSLSPYINEYGFDIHVPEFRQVVPEQELISMVPQFDGWIIGDDPATAAVFEAGISGRLRAAVKWGVGTDNVDFETCKRLGIPITNTPGVFGNEVADVALGYLLMLTRRLHEIDAGVRDGRWPKPPGMTLVGRRMTIVGFGDIGRNIAKRANAFGINCDFYDPYAEENSDAVRVDWPNGVSQSDFLVVSCKLTPETRGVVSREVLSRLPDSSFVINVSRGPVVDEAALIDAIAKRDVAGAGLDVFDVEPLASDNPLRELPSVILGTHNSSNTVEAVTRVSRMAIEKMSEFLSEIERE